MQGNCVNFHINYVSSTLITYSLLFLYLEIPFKEKFQGKRKDVKCYKYTSHITSNKPNKVVN